MVRLAVLTVILATASALPLRLESGDFKNGGTIPRTFMAERCGGTNRSLALAWNEAPPRTGSFAIIVHDPDAPRPGGFYHWVVYNLPLETRRLQEDVKLRPDQLGLTSAQRPGYTGPCPPPGPAHHYHITLYAIDLTRIVLPQPPTGPELERHIVGHIVASAALEGTAQTR
jgi:hypothetical protein